MMDFCEKIIAAFPESIRTVKGVIEKEKNVKSVISIIIHNLKFQLQKDCNRYIKTAVDHPTKDSIYRSLLKDIIS